MYSFYQSTGSECPSDRVTRAGDGEGFAAAVRVRAKPTKGSPGRQREQGQRDAQNTPAHQLIRHGHSPRTELIPHLGRNGIKKWTADEVGLLFFKLPGISRRKLRFGIVRPEPGIVCFPALELFTLHLLIENLLLTWVLLLFGHLLVLLC